MEGSPGDVTLLLGRLANGDRSAEAQLIPLVYDELRRLAASYMRREQPGHTLQPTAVVHEAYLRLIEQRDTNWQNRAHFFGVAAQLMRRILVDHARSRGRVKRGGCQQRIPLDDALRFSREQAAELLAIHEALISLEKVDQRQTQIVMLRFFGGLTEDQIAEVLKISPKTVQREWSFAKAWLHREMSKS